MKRLQVYLVQSPPKAQVRPWEYFDVDGLMVSAYDFFASKSRLEECIRKGIHDLLDFDGPIMLDSGGYQSLRGKGVHYSAIALARFAVQCEADHVMALDFPPGALKPASSQGKKLVSTNFRNFRKMRRITEKVIPVVHAPTEFLRSELKLLSRVDFELLAFGGLLPSQKGGLRETLNALNLVTSSCNTRLHILGFAAPSKCRHLSSKVSSTDFAGWRNAAAFGYVLLPTGYRKVSARNLRGHACRPNQDELSMIRSICKKLNLKKGSVFRSFAARAILSAYVAAKVLPYSC